MARRFTLSCNPARHAVAKWTRVLDRMVLVVEDLIYFRALRKALLVTVFAVCLGSNR